MAKRGKTCPLCGKPAADQFRPFCSRACANRDLLAWLGGGYALPGPPADEDDVREASDGKAGA